MVFDHTVKHNGVIYETGQDVPVSYNADTKGKAVEPEKVEQPKRKRGTKSEE